jgi:hypothetical protein
VFSVKLDRRRAAGFQFDKRRSRRRRRFVAAVERLEDRRLMSADVSPFTKSSPPVETESVARLWNEALLDAIRIDTPRPTVHARNLFHTSVAMYDAWAAFDPQASGYFTNERVFGRRLSNGDPRGAAEAISYAAYGVLSHRFQNSPGAATSLAEFDTLMRDLGFDPTVTKTRGNSPAAIGNRIADTMIAIGLTDGANELGGYADTTGYVPQNPPLDVTQSGTQLDQPNLWQPLIVAGNTQKFLTSHWGDVDTFAIDRDSNDSVVYLDPGPPPLLGGTGDAEFKEAILRVIRFSSVLDPGQGEVIDISPSAVGNSTLGTNDGRGHAVNPTTGQPYEPNLVNLGDWGRVLAEFWADGPKSETPPGHWNTIANCVTDEMERLGIRKQIAGRGRPVSDLEWDVKLYFTLNGALHDAAIAAWDVKEEYDYVRPISMIRYMGGLGQSSDPSGPAYDPQGLPLEAGLVEVITSATTAVGQRHQHLAGKEGEIAIYAWAGHPDDPNGVGGVDWVLATDWLPYQAENFVTPPFGGYISGHSTFSRASAEVLTRFTGDPFFPGGVGTFVAPADSFLRFEGGPTETVTLQWATYYDAADEAGLSRLYGGIHVDADDFAGRVVGSQDGIAAFREARSYFYADAHRRWTPILWHHHQRLQRLFHQCLQDHQPLSRLPVKRLEPIGAQHSQDPPRDKPELIASGTTSQASRTTSITDLLFASLGRAFTQGRN